jgi:hypothetical protein
MFIIKDLICGKVVGYQKNLGLIFLSLVFQFGFMQLFVAKTTPTSYTNLNVPDKHVFSKHLCHGFYCGSQALCAFPTHQ